MRTLVYALATAGVTIGVALIPTATNHETRYADAPRVERMTVENTRLICVENRCYDANKLPTRYRSLAERQSSAL